MWKLFIFKYRTERLSVQINNYYFFMSETLVKYEELLEKPIIIFGSGRSGTTIISEIIFQHEDLAWHSNYQELFPKFAPINFMRRVFDNKMWRIIGMNT